MGRITDLSIEQIADELKPLFRKFTLDYGDFTNQAGVLAHSPGAFRHLYGLLDEWRGYGTLPRRLVEIAVVTASRVNECSYCVGHHGAALVDLGLVPKPLTVYSTRNRRALMIATCWCVIMRGLSPNGRGESATGCFRT